MSPAGGHGGTDGCSTCERRPAEIRKLLPARAGGPLRICDRCVRECASAMTDGPTRIPGRSHACAFCLKTEDQVAVIVGIGAQKICDECVDAYRAALG